MPVQPFDNTNLINMCRDCGAVGFLPVVTYSFDAAANSVVVTNNSTIPAGDTLAKIHVRLTDQFGGEVRADVPIVASPGNTVAISSATLNKSKGLNLMVTILTTQHIAADGSAFWLMAAGDVASWDVQKNA